MSLANSRIEQAEAHRADVEGCTTADALRDYLASIQEHIGASGLEHPEVRDAWVTAAWYARAMDDELLRRMVQEVRLADHLARNPHLSNDQKYRVVELLIEYIEEGAQRRSSALHEWPPRHLRRWAEMGVLNAQSEFGERLHAILQTPAGVRPPDASARAAVHRTLPHLPDTPAAWLAEMAAETQGDSLMHMCAHPNADHRTWECVFAPPWESPRLALLASVPRARQDARIRPALREFGRFASADVLKELARDASPEEFPELVRDLVRLDMRLVPEVLSQAEPALLAGLTQQDWAMMLKSADEGVRMAAIRAAGAPAAARPPHARAR